MFCPNCSAEYRSGFAQCSDCGVKLVEHLPNNAAAGDAETQTDPEGHELLWSGISPGPGDGIRDALDAAGIVHKDTDKDFGFLPTFSQSAQFIWIDPHDRNAAGAVLAEVLRKFEDGDLEPQGSALNRDAAGIDPFALNRRVFNRPSNEGVAIDAVESAFAEPQESDEPVPDDVVEDFDPDDATTEVWAGEDSEAAENFKNCLSGVASDVS